MVSFYILIAALGAMAIMMLAIPIPHKDERLSGYILSRYLLSASYVLLGIYCYFKGRMTLELMSPIFLFMANLQAVLLAISHINLINPQLTTKRYVIIHLLPMAVCLLIYVLVRIWAPHIDLTSYAALRAHWHEPEVLARIVWMVQYIALCFYFTAVFIRESRRWRSLASDYFADEDIHSSRLICASLTCALLVGYTTFAIAANVSPTLSTVLNAQILVLYIVLGSLFLQYPSVFIRMKPVLYEPENTAAEKEAEISDQRWVRARNKIMKSGLYLQQGVTLEQVAHEIGMSRTILSNTINREEGVNFNAFINNLRIQEAQRLMCEQPELNLREIAEQVGYSEQSNFTRYFKQYAGSTPREWKER